MELLNTPSFGAHIIGQLVGQRTWDPAAWPWWQCLAGQIHPESRRWSKITKKDLKWLVSFDTHCNGNSVYIFLFWELRGLSPNFYIHVFVSDLYNPGSVHIFPPAEKADPSWDYIIHSQTHECGNWDWDPDIPFLGIFASNFRHFFFAVQVLVRFQFLMLLSLQFLEAIPLKLNTGSRGYLVYT